ncbi:MAG TPA: PKD domain-containing protein [Conexibacter sp.]|nr:PKD domain-containing protein [Conexibacter sp.]
MNLPRRVGLVAALAALVLAVTATSALAAFGELSAFGSYGTTQGAFKLPQFVDVDTQQSQVLVGDFNTALDVPFRIVPFTHGGTSLPPYATDTASLSSILDGAVDSANRRVYVVERDRPSPDDPPPPPSDDVLQLGLDGGHVQSLFAAGTIGRALDPDTNHATGKLDPMAIAVVPAGSPGAGDVYVAGLIGTAGGASTHLAVLRFDAAGNELNEIGGGNGTAPGTFNPGSDGFGIRGLAVDPRDGSVWVLDSFNDDLATAPAEDNFGRVQHFSPTGTFIEQIASSDAHPIYAAGTNADVAVGPDGSVWLDTFIADTGSGEEYGVIRFAPQQGGGYQEAQRFGTAGTGSCQFPAAPLLAVAGTDVWTTVGRLLPTLQGYAKVKLFGAGGSGCAGGNQAPVITPGSVQADPATPVKGEQIALTAAATDDGPAGDLTWQWDLDGDGSYDGSPSASSAASTTLSTVGPVTLKVKVTDADGESDEQTLDLVVTSQKPVASFTASTTTPVAGQDVTFDGSGSHDPDGTIASYEWDTGSGFHAGGATLHASFTAGAHTVRLRVTDADGDVSTAARKDLVVAPVHHDPPGGGPAPDTTPPRLTLGKPAQKGTSGLTLTVACPATEHACTGTAVLETATAVAAKRGRKAKKKVLTLGSARFSLAGGNDAKLTIKLSAKARKLLKHGKLRAKLVITVRDAAGNSSTSTKSVGLKAPRKRR